MSVPFFRPFLTEAEIAEVVACLRSGWLTTGPRTRQFEEQFAQQVGGRHAVALNSCTAALALALEALNLGPGQAVLVPTMTFAATAEVIFHLGAVPLLVDCDPVTLNMDLQDAQKKIEQLRSGQTPLNPSLRVAGIIPVHVGGLMIDMDEVQTFAKRNNLWYIEDAAHCFPAAYRGDAGQPWRRCGESTSMITCFSFYANKTITTGEGGIAVSNDKELIDHMRQMSLHGLSHNLWSRNAGDYELDYRIVAPGYKCNLTDVASAIGIHQLARAEQMRGEREAIAQIYLEQLADVEQIELPPAPLNRIHSWHLFPIRLRAGKHSIDRNTLLRQLLENGVGCSVHWRPLHLHPYYENTCHWKPEHLPVASSVWQRLISLPIFPGMQKDEQEFVINTLRNLCAN
ncbi:MAG: DegT/DnrJ/EryC1/StrS family aminotransferase [Candidatus Riflebacteria bacterium]|nr:DegT/DnrJ/EryC1/StrS family aminotransferase [Candidatus Riflebacteria bacterium]